MDRPRDTLGLDTIVSNDSTPGTICKVFYAKAYRRTGVRIGIGLVEGVDLAADRRVVDVSVGCYEGSCSSQEKDNRDSHLHNRTKLEMQQQKSLSLGILVSDLCTVVGG